MKMYKRIIYIIILLVFSMRVFAEDGEVMEPEQQEESGQSSSSQQNPSAQRDAPALEEFVPSEEVSIDRPVALPTDI